MTLVLEQQFFDYLGSTANTDRARVALAAAEAAFAADCNRSNRPFLLTGAAQTEVYDGTGCQVLYTRYPVASLTSIKLGNDFSDPDETLAVADKDVLTYQVGTRRLVRRDGGVFGERSQADIVQVVYTAAADADIDDAKGAVMELAGALYHRGPETGISQERLGEYSVQHLGDVKASLVLYPQAVANHVEAPL